MTFTGRNGFTVIWDCSEQTYEVFKDGVFFGIRKYRFADVKTYLD